MSKLKTSSIYFTATRNIKATDIINAFVNKLHLGNIDEEYINIVPVTKKDYNHVFFSIEWNETEEAEKFISELISKSSIKVYHNKGYWLCRMNRDPLKLRNKKAECIKFASTVVAEKSNTTSVSHMFNDDEFYVIN